LKKKKEKHSIYLDLRTQEGKERWGIFSNIKEMTQERKSNLE
jgi:hypothetical protein